MAGWLSTLAVRYRAAYPGVQRGVREGLSIAKIGDALRADAHHLSNAVLREMVSRERALVQASSALKFLPFDRPIGPERLMEALTKVRKAYTFQVRVGFVWNARGEREERFVTVVSNRVMTRRQVEDTAQQQLEKSAGRYGVQIESVQIASGMRMGAKGRF